MSDDGKTAKGQHPEGQTRGDLADAPNFQQTLKPGQGVNMTDLRVDQEIVMRLRAYSHLAHAAASWGFAGEGFWMDRGADLIEEQAAEIERLGRELNKAKYGDPDFSWEAHQAALDAAQAEIERLHLLLAERAVDQKKGPGDEAEAS